MPDFSYRSSRLVTVLCLLALFAVGWMCLPGLAYGGHWTDESVKLFQTLPVQESGRVKPLDTVARFLLLRLNGKRSVTIEEDGQRRSLSASEWLLNCLFYPDESKEYAHFSVDSYELITAIGLMPHGKKRDRYSYGELEPALDRLYALAQEASLRPEDGRALVDQQLLALANNILLYEEIVHFLEFARLRLPVKESALLTELFPEEERVPLSQVVHKLPDHLQLLVSQSEGMDEATRQGIAADLEQLFGKLDEVGATARFLSFFPPFDRKEQEWMNPALYLEAAFTGMPEERVRGTLAWFETLVDNPQNTVVFEKTLKELHDSFVTEAQARGEYRRIPLEVHFYKGRYLFFSQWLFVVSFLLMAVSWTRPVDSRFTKLVTWSIVPPLLLLAIGITLRCIIRGRPPVTTLYETVLFTTLVAVALGFFVEFTSRNRIAVSVAALLGTFGMFFAWKYEASEAVDTMPAVIAVLDTNFWLATHVTTIIAGYGAGLFAAALAHVYFIFHVPLFKKNNRQTLQNLTSSIYGVMTFSLVFTLIGTVLGGVWAAQSWGRFWGWDPKENGALMIVLWILAILHARRGGYIKARGLAISALLLGMIVVFAWWGVNALGVGLHSYGFTTGIWRSLALFWIVETFCIAAAFAISILFPVTAEKMQLPEKA